jgi:cell division transport system permease protein
MKSPKKKKVFGSYPFITVSISTIIAMGIIGIVTALLLFAQQLTDNIKNKIELHVFLNNVSETERIQLITILSSKPFVKKNEGKAQITFLSQKEAEKEFLNETEDDLSIFEISPIKSSLIIQIDPEYSSVQSLNEAKATIESNKAVFEVDLRDEWKETMQAIYDNMYNVMLFLICFSTIAIATIVLLINNTIKLALYSQRFLIRSMQLVGAKRSFIIKPFIYRSVLHGTLAGAIASILLYSLFTYSITVIPDLSFVYDSQKIFLLLTSLPIIGCIINVMSTWLAVLKYLKMSLDELY